MNIRRRITNLVGCILLCTAGGCSGTAGMRPTCPPMEAGFRPDASQSREYPYSELREGQALILFVRPSRFSEEAVIEVLVNGRNVGMLRAKRYTLVHVRPGSSTFLARAVGQEPAEFHMLVEPGKIYFVEVAPGKRSVSARVRGHIISPEHGRRELSSCELEGGHPAARQED